MPKYSVPAIEAALSALGIDVRLWQSTEPPAFFSSALQADEQKAVTSFRSAKRQRERATVRHLLHHEFNIASPIAYAPNGRPFLSGDEQTKIGISHTADIVCLATARHRFGIDIEQRTPRGLRISRAFLSPTELALLYAQSEEERATWATAMWSAKEAVYKCVSDQNLSLTHGITIETISPTNTTNEAIIEVTTSNSPTPITVHCFFEPSFVLTVAQ